MKRFLFFFLLLASVTFNTTSVSAAAKGSFFFSAQSNALLGTTGLTMTNWSWDQQTGNLSTTAAYERKSEWNPSVVVTANNIVVSGRIDPKTHEFTGTFSGHYINRGHDGKLLNDIAVHGTMLADWDPAQQSRLTWNGTVDYKRSGTRGELAEKTTFKMYAPDSAPRPDAVIAVPPNATTPAPEQTAIHITVLTGDVEYSRDGGKTYLPLTKDVVLQKGDFISTGFDSRATVNFGYGTLNVLQLTNLRLDEFTSKENLQKTQLYLYVGAVQAKVRHTPSIRSDFAVRTPTASASIRGSEMAVSFDKTTQLTTVSTIEDMAYVQGTNDPAELTVPQGQSTTVPATGNATTPVSMKPTTEPVEPSAVATTPTDVPSATTPTANDSQATPTNTPPGQSMLWPFIIGVVIFAILLLALALYFRTRPQPPAPPLPPTFSQ